MELVDGYYGKSHITADQVGDLNIGMFGAGSYVFSVGNALAHEIVTNNKVLIKDGAFVHQGRRGLIKAGTTETAIIANGAQNMKRNDFICIRYQKNMTTAVESFSLIVITGKSGTTAIDPVPVAGNIRVGETISDFPIRRVRINGLSIEGIDPLCPVLQPLSSMLLKVDSPSGWKCQEIMGVRRCWINKSATVSSVYSQSSAEYNATVEIVLPVAFRPSDPLTITSIATVKAAGLFKATFVAYNSVNGSLIYYISANATFNNYPLIIGVNVICEI